MRYVFTAGICVLACLCSAQQPGPAPANAQFEKMKTLVGEWESKRPNGTVLRNSFRVFGEGSALLHMEKPEGRQEIITIFYPAGNELRGDHYCFTRNQPRYVATAVRGPKCH